MRSMRFGKKLHILLVLISLCNISVAISRRINSNVEITSTNNGASWLEQKQPTRRKSLLRKGLSSTKECFHSIIKRVFSTNPIVSHLFYTFLIPSILMLFYLKLKTPSKPESTTSTSLSVLKNPVPLLSFNNGSDCKAGYAVPIIN